MQQLVDERLVKLQHLHDLFVDDLKLLSKLLKILSLLAVSEHSCGLFV